MYQGGYYRIKEPLIKNGHYKHTAALDHPISQTMIDAVNLVQSVPRRINVNVLGVMKEAWKAGEVIGDLPQSEDTPLPSRLPDDVWVSLPKEERAAHKAKRSMIHGENARLQSKRASLLRKVQIADELHARTLWFPHSLDFRGRMYPLPQDLNPQGDDVARSLLMFDEGKPFGDVGGYWLAVAIANAFGYDKVTFAERVKWVEEHHEDIVDSVFYPFEGKRFWTTADEPWTALALCFEWIEYVEKGPDGINRVPVHLDGSCNGLQHLSAMGLDPVGARLTNLTPVEEKLDLYSVVAESVAKAVALDAANGIDEAFHWIGKVDRKTVKRAVMTTPYGVTSRGVRDQLISDRHVVGLEGSPLHNAEYLKDKIQSAIRDNVVAARNIMAYIQEVARRTAEKDIPLQWTTPAGMTVKQAYWRLNANRVDTLFGGARITSQLWSEDKNLGLSLRKQTLASAPNVIHSFDAAHLARTVIGLKERHSISSVSVIHDSYGTHASDIPAMRAVLRSEFVSIYSEDRLSEFARNVDAVTEGKVSLPDLPARGNFNIREVLKAQYFFS